MEQFGRAVTVCLASLAMYAVGGCDESPDQSGRDGPDSGASADAGFSFAGSGTLALTQATRLELNRTVFLIPEHHGLSAAEIVRQVADNPQPTVGEREDSARAQFLEGRWGDSAGAFEELALEAQEQGNFERAAQMYFMAAIACSHDASQTRRAAEFANSSNQLAPFDASIPALRAHLWAVAGDNLEVLAAQSQADRVIAAGEGNEVALPLLAPALKIGGQVAISLVVKCVRPVAIRLAQIARHAWSGWSRALDLKATIETLQELYPGDSAIKEIEFLADEGDLESARKRYLYLMLEKTLEESKTIGS